jgi:acetyl esterase/lipase
MSTPASARGISIAWISEGVTNFASASARSTEGRTPSTANASGVGKWSVLSLKYSRFLRSFAADSRDRDRPAQEIHLPPTACGETARPLKRSKVEETMKPIRWMLVTAALLPALVADAQRIQRPQTLPANIDFRPNLEYAKPDGKPQYLDLYLPKNAEGKLPIIVAIHGGGWSGGDKARPQILPLLRDGYAVASINYRLSQVAKFPAQVHDCKAAIRWVRAHADELHLDADRIGIWGDSAGGHLVALLGTTADNKELEGEEGNANFSSRVQAVCDYYGPADFLTINDQAPPDTAIHHNAPDSPEAKLIGGAIPENKEKAALASPVHYASKDAAPFLIMHGDVDKVVPVQQSIELRDALQKAGVEASLYIIGGQGHGFRNHPELIPMMRAFFDRHLKTPQPTR